MKFCEKLKKLKKMINFNILNKKIQETDSIPLEFRQDAANINTKISELSGVNQELSAENKDLKTKLEEKEKKIIEYENKVAMFTGEISRLNAKSSHSSTNVNVSEAKINALLKENDDLKKENQGLRMKSGGQEPGFNSDKLSMVESENLLLGNKIKELERGIIYYMKLNNDI